MPNVGDSVDMRSMSRQRRPQVGDSIKPEHVPASQYELEQLVKSMTSHVTTNGGKR